MFFWVFFFLKSSILTTIITKKNKREILFRLTSTLAGQYTPPKLMINREKVERNAWLQMKKSFH